jgi:predicted nucleic acid-binding Zn ribbon protein
MPFVVKPKVPEFFYCCAQCSNSLKPVTYCHESAHFCDECNAQTRSIGERSVQTWSRCYQCDKDFCSEQCLRKSPLTKKEKVMHETKTIHKQNPVKKTRT